MLERLYNTAHQIQLDFSEPSQPQIDAVNLFYMNLLFFFKEVYFFGSSFSFIENIIFYRGLLCSMDSANIAKTLTNLKSNRDAFIYHRPISEEKAANPFFENKIPIIVHCEDYLRWAFDIAQDYSQYSILTLNLANSQRLGGVASYDIGSAEETWCRLSDLFLVMLMDHVTDEVKKAQMLLFLLEKIEKIVKTGRVLIKTPRDYINYAHDVTEIIHSMEIHAYKIDLDHPHYNPVIITRDPHHPAFENLVPQGSDCGYQHYSKIIQKLLKADEALLGKSVLYFVSSGSDKAAVDHRHTGLFDRAASGENLFMSEESSALLMKRAIQQIIDESYTHQIDIINLSAFGCGAFLGDPRHVAQYFCDVFSEKNNVHKLTGKILHFGIFSDNYSAFVDCLKSLEENYFSIHPYTDKAIGFSGKEFYYLHNPLGFCSHQPEVVLEVFCEHVLTIPSDALVIIAENLSNGGSGFFGWSKEPLPPILKTLVQQQAGDVASRIEAIYQSLPDEKSSDPIIIQGAIHALIAVKIPAYSVDTDALTALKSGFLAALEVAHAHQLSSLTFPLILSQKSTISCFRRAEIAAEAFKAFLMEKSKTSLKSIILTVTPGTMKAREVHVLKERFREVIFHQECSELIFKR